MKLGLYCNSFAWSGGDESIGRDLAEMARDAEAAGFRSFWLMDHFFQLPRHGKLDDPMLEAYTTLGYLAGVTNRIQLGTMVTGVTYWHPSVLVKMVSALDVLSGGRATLGIGAAWFEQEHDGLGILFPPLAERFERLAETLQIAHVMWSGRVEQFHGRHYQLDASLCQPLPLQRPHPPILVGGRGERKTLRLVAKYGDACNFTLFDHLPNLSAPSALAEVEHKLSVLRDHCQTENRAYDTIERTVFGWLPIVADDQVGGVSPDAAIGVFERYAALGVDELMIATSTLMPDGPDPTLFSLFTDEIVRRVSALAVAGRT